MTYSVQSNAFRADKNLFFTHQRDSVENTDNKIHAIDGRVKRISYTFLLNNQKLLETEFTELFAVLQNQKDDKEKEVFWLYCYYCASLLETFHTAYSQTAKADDYSKIKEQIKSRLNKQVRPQSTSVVDDDTDSDSENTEEKSFIATIYDKIVGDFNGLINTPYHVSQIRNQIGFINMMRIYWIFNRLTITQGLLVARDLNLIDKLDAALGTHTDVDKIISGFQVPTPIINYFSVGLFLGRFIIDAGMLLKHTFFPTALEARNTTAMERFKYEFQKRHWGFLNDIAWGTVNFLTNFSHITKISGPVAGYLIAGFLTFDLAMIFYKMSLDREDYLAKKAQYVQEMKEYLDLTQHEDITVEQRHTYIEMLTKQMAELDRSWQVKEATLYFLAAAAALVALGFTASLIVGSPVLVIGFYFVALIGVAMYLSAGAYSKYKEKSLILEQADLSEENHALALKEYEIARNEFIFTMVKNAVVPMVLITTFAICWPAAIVLTTLYLGYEAFHAYSQYVANNAAKQLALDPPEEASPSLAMP